VKLAKLSAKEHAALVLFEEAASGGDPHMGMVSIATVEKLKKRGLVRPHTPEEATRLKRHHVPTSAGYAWIDAMRHGPWPAPSVLVMCSDGRDHWLEEGRAS
jgi:hypothetical protein